MKHLAILALAALAVACGGATLRSTVTVQGTMADDGCIPTVALFPVDSLGVVKVEATRDTTTGTITTLYNQRPPATSLPYSFVVTASMPAGVWYVRATANGKSAPGCVGWWTAKTVLGRPWARAQ